MVSGVCDRNGHRNIGTGEDRRAYHAPHEDQTAIPLDELNLHDDCKEAIWHLYGTEIEKFFGPRFGPELNKE